MAMNTCQTCKHRGDEAIKSTGAKPTTYYQCMRVEHDDEEKFEPGQRAVVIDGSGYSATLCVELTFGCIFWEANP